MGPLFGSDPEETQTLERHKLELLGRFASGIVHDFNNVLTGILGTTALLEESGMLASAQLADVQEIERSAKRAAALAQQILDFSRRRGHQPGPEDIDEVVRGMELLLRRVLGGERAFSLRLEPGLPRVLIHRGQMEQVLLNLTANARDAMPGGGTLLIETVRAEEGVLVRVADSGTGIPEELLGRIFEPYFTTKEEHRGCGLGLSIVRGIVEGWGGSISVSSRPGEGTCFAVVLPAAPEGRP